MPTPPPVARTILLSWVGVFIATFIASLFGIGLDVLSFDPRGLLDGRSTAFLGVFTHVFVHAGLIHIVMNAWLFLVFAPEVEVLFPGKRMVRLLAYAGGAGVLTGLLMSGLLPDRFNASIVGGSGLVMAAIAANVAVYPDRRLSLIIIHFRARTFFMVLIAMDVLGLIATIAGTTGGVAYELHLAGAAVGWGYAGGFSHLPSPWRRWSANRARKRQEDQRRTAQADDAEEDRILAKISREGITALTDRERAFLHRRSQQRKDGRR